MNEEVQIITVAELKKKMESPDNIQVVNVLSPQGWERGVIPCSLLIPGSAIEERLHELDKQKEIITYCSNYICQASKNVAKFLIKKGYNAKAYEGGIQEWIETGNPTDSAPN